MQNKRNKDWLKKRRKRLAKGIKQPLKIHFNLEMMKKNQMKLEKKHRRLILKLKKTNKKQRMNNKINK